MIFEDRTSGIENDKDCPSGAALVYYLFIILKMKYQRRMTVEPDICLLALSV